MLQEMKKIKKKCIKKKSLYIFGFYIIQTHTHIAMWKNNRGEEHKPMRQQHLLYATD
jgi:hypothetical protein